MMLCRPAERLLLWSRGGCKRGAPPPQPWAARSWLTTSATTSAPARCDFAIIGCGAPNRGMGWFHARQILSGETPTARLTDVVEPWFLGEEGGSAAGADEFREFQAEAEAQGVRFFRTVEEMPAVDTAGAGAPKVALIAARATDCPGLFRASIEKGCQHVYLEKPGAPTVEAMESMADYAEQRGAVVSMGYNKNVSSYVAAAREVEAELGCALDFPIHVWPRMDDHRVIQATGCN